MAKELDLSRCGLSRLQNFDLLKRGLKDLPRSISTISLKGNGIQFLGSRLESFWEALQNIPSQVEFIDLSENHFEQFNYVETQRLISSIPSTVKYISIGDGRPCSLQAILYKAYYQAMYERWAKKSTNFKDLAQFLLNDYTKGNSRFWRFATLHWNRSHTHQITAILELIKNGTINNHQDFFSALDRITSCE